MQQQHEPYTHSSKTDVLKTYRRHGWVPPSEQAEFQDKWKYYRSLPMQEPEQCEHQTCQRQMDGSTTCN